MYLAEFSSSISKHRCRIYFVPSLPDMMHLLTSLTATFCSPPILFFFLSSSGRFLLVQRTVKRTLPSSVWSGSSASHYGTLASSCFSFFFSPSTPRSPACVPSLLICTHLRVRCSTSMIFLRLLRKDTTRF